MHLRSLSRLGVAARLTLGFLAVAVIALLIGGVGLYASSRLNMLAESMYTRDLLGLQHTARANQQLLMTARAIRIAALAPDQVIREAQLTSARQHLEELQRELSRSAVSGDDRTGQAILQETTQSALRYTAGIQQVGRLISQEPLQPVRASVSMLYREIVPLANQIDQSMKELIEYRQRQARTLSQETRALYDQTVLLIVILTLIGAFCAMILGFFLARGLMRQLGSEPAEVARIAHTIATGDLSQAIDASKAPRHSVLDAMAQMQLALKRIVASVRASSDHIATGTHQIQLGNSDLAQRTERQAADISETAAAMEEITGTVHSNTDATRQAAALAARANEAALRSLERIGQIEAAIRRQEENSREIEGITGLIDGIAFQTNMLALNAAIEAARAGIHGRGFAVVATQVQDLASRSSSAARDIAALIEGNSSHAALMAQGVQAAAQDIRASGERIGELDRLVSQIQASTEEQACGLAQINTAIGQLSDITQSNASLVEEAAAASSGLARQASTLVTTVGEFHLEPASRALVPV
ncbi:methyl-accepting chemotaxis protein [Castellaniella sp. MT123]|uniref:methyl-accepting chemotaxis protein n=1 Tax=Castellaniella sp. MT123 TaxID=3140381 RepID=UPI0031F3DC83